MPDREKVLKDFADYEPYARDLPAVTIKSRVYMDALELLKEQEAVTPYIDIDEAKCPICKVKLTRQELLGDDVLFEDFFDYCPHCGRTVKWNERSNGNNTQTN